MLKDSAPQTVTVHKYTTEIKNLDLYKEIKNTRHGRQNPTVLSLISRRDKCVSQFSKALVFAEEYKKIRHLQQQSRMGEMS